MPLKLFALISSIGIMTGLFCAPDYSCAATRLDVGAEAEYDISDYERSPAPAIATTGSDISQQYVLYADGGMFKRGTLDLSLGATFGDRFRRHATDFEDSARFDYDRWFRAETRLQHDTDVEIFFSGTSQPQSPIHSVKEKYSTRLRLNQVSDVEYDFESIKREDLALGTLTNDMTRFHAVKFNSQTEPWLVKGEYRQSDFRDRLGKRSNVDSRGLNLDTAWKPSDFFNVSGSFEDTGDTNIANSTGLRSMDSGVEMSLSPIRQVKLRNKVRFREDVNTQTEEDIDNISNEIILNIDPLSRVNLEFAYKRQAEEKKRRSSDITSTVNEERFAFGLAPLRRIGVHGGLSVSDKSSTSQFENLRNTNVYADVSCDLLSSLRLSANISRSEQENTFTSLIQSDTTSLSTGLQYRPKRSFYLYMHLDTTRTDNPSTGAFTANDSVSASLNIEPLDFFTAVLRTSAQKTSGSSESSLSERLLNSAGFDIRPFKNFKISPEFEFISSSGAAASEESLFDTSILYTMGRFDLSLRFQNKETTGQRPTSQTSLLSSVKYKMSKNLVLSTRFSSITYTDQTTVSNSYNSTMIEGLVSLRF